ncbi:MAG: NirA family protein [Puniceicoccaceae bacterium]
MKKSPIPERILGTPLGPDQKSYLDGFFNGLATKGITFGDLQPPPSEEEEPILIAEERIKREEHPLDSYYRIVENSRGSKNPDKEETFRFKWHGLFFLSPVKDAFMARLRIPGGQLKTFQLREIARAATELTTGYVQITTRANFQIRLIQAKDTPEFLRRIQSVGLHTRGAGADNIRNITCNPTAGVDPVEFIDCTPIVNDLAQFILSQREFYDLPRKFNIAFDGGGLIGSVEDTNDIGVKAVRRGEEVLFRIALGGATGHKSFARDLGVTVPPSEILNVVVALIRVFIRHGNRNDRKKARLKHLLDTWTLDQYLAETEKVLGYPLVKSPPTDDTLLYPSQQIPHSHIGAYPQKQKGLNYLGIALPIGQITPKQLQRLADLADHYGSGEIRLTVWQNLVIPNISDAYLETVKKAVLKLGLDYRQSNITSGIIACTGNRYCKYSSTDTKGHALELSKYLNKRLTLDQPVNIHFTGCPHSCAQHYMGDIGLLGAKTRDGEEAYHLCVGGGFGANQAVGRQIFQAMPFEEIKPTIERLLLRYLADRLPGESFQAFSNRHEVGQLQEMIVA